MASPFLGFSQKHRRTACMSDYTVKLHSCKEYYPSKGINFDVECPWLRPAQAK